MPQVYKKYKKSNTWNIRLLVDDSFVPSSKQPSVIYCKLTDFYPQNKVQDVGFNEFIFFLATANRKTKLGILVLFTLVVISGFTCTSAAVIQRIVCHGELNEWSLFLYRGMIQMLLTGLLVKLNKKSFLGPKETR